MVEYALILVFVSIAVLVIASIIGLAVQRIYGVVGGAVGGTHNTSCSGGSGHCDPSEHYLTISNADCFISTVGGNTTFVLRGEISDAESVANSNYDLNISTDTGLMANRVTAGGVDGSISIGGTSGGLLFVYKLTNGANASVCPHSATVQTRDLIAVSPVTVKP